MTQAQTNSTEQGGIFNRVGNFKNRLALSAAGLVLSATALAACAGQGEAAPEPTTTQSQEGEATQEPQDTAEVVYNYELSDLLITPDMSPQEIAETQADIFTAIQSGNVNTATYDLRFSDEYVNMTKEEYANKLAVENVTSIFEAVMVENWRDVPELATLYNGWVKSNATSIINNDGDLERGAKLTSLGEVNGDANTELRISAVYEAFYRGSEGDINNETINGKSELITTTFVNDGGSLRISDFDSVLN